MAISARHGDSYHNMHRNVLDEPPPHNFDAEVSVLGSMMFDSRCIPQVMSFVTADDFYHTSHQHIFMAIADLYHANMPVDSISVPHYLETKRIFGEEGGSSYVSQIAGCAWTTETVPYYAKMVRGLATKRQLRREAFEIIAIAQDTQDSMDAVTQAQAKLIRIAEREIGGVTVSHVGPVVENVLKTIEERITAPSYITGVSSGWRDLDMMTGGWQKSDLIIVAARPSMGKTAFMLNMVENCVIEQQKPALIFSLEMSREQLVQRIISSMAGVSMQDMRTGFLSKLHHEKVIKASEILNRAPLYIEDQSGVSPSRMKIVAQQIAMQTAGQLELIAVDYLQLMGVERGMDLSEGNYKTSYISQSLKGLAKDLKVPVVALSQLSRAVEARPDKKPMLSDLRDSGSIEQDADIVTFLFREEYYNRETDRRGIADIMIAKQRNGPVGDVELIWNHNTTRFLNKIPVAPKYDLPAP